MQMCLLYCKFQIYSSTFVTAGVQSHTEVTGILGTTVTLKFSFSPEVKIQKNSHIVVHHNRTQSKKVAEYTESNMAKAFDMHPEMNAVFWHITSVRLNDSGIYRASHVRKEGSAQKSNMVEVKIREVNANSTGEQIWLYYGPKMLCVIFLNYLFIYFKRYSSSRSE